MQHKWKRLISYYRPYRGLFFSDMVFAILGAAVTLAIPLIVRYITTTVVLLPGEEALQIILRLGAAMVAMVALESGRMMEKKMRRSVAPSMRADSSRLSGMERKKLFMMMQLYALTRPGRISARMLSIRPIV